MEIADYGGRQHGRRSEQVSDGDGHWREGPGGPCAGLDGAAGEARQDVRAGETHREATRVAWVSGRMVLGLASVAWVSGRTVLCLALRESDALRALWRRAECRVATGEVDCLGHMPVGPSRSHRVGASVSAFLWEVADP